MGNGGQLVRPIVGLRIVSFKSFRWKSGDILGAADTANSRVLGTRGHEAGTHGQGKGIQVPGFYSGVLSSTARCAMGLRKGH